MMTVFGCVGKGGGRGTPELELANLCTRSLMKSNHSSLIKLITHVTGVDILGISSRKPADHSRSDILPVGLCRQLCWNEPRIPDLQLHRSCCSALSPTG